MGVRGLASLLLKSTKRGPSPRFLHSQAEVAAEPVHGDPRFLRFNSPAPGTVEHSRILQVPSTRITTLPSGLRVATESHLAAHTASIAVWIDAGSRFETASTNGTAHFLEHMIFKGTARRTTRQLEETIENAGGHLNAYTAREQTAYFAQVLRKDVPFAVDVLADILQNSSFEPRRIERERGVILREMQEVETQEQEVVFDHLHSIAFQNSSLGRTILGPVENVKSITRQNLADYIATHYTAPRMVIAAAGAIHHEEMVELARRLFTNLSQDPTTAAELIKNEPAVFTGSEIRVQKEMPFAHVAIAFQGASWADPDSTALMLIQMMLGVWNKSAGAGKHMGSMLAQKVAADELAESFMAFNTNYADTGLFGVYAIAEPQKLQELSYAILYELGRLTSHISEEDLVRTRNQLKACLLLHLDSTTATVEDIGRQLLTYGRRMPLAELFARIDAVDVDIMKKVAHRFIHDKDVAIASLGPVDSLPDHSWFRRHTCWPLPSL